MVGQQLLSDLVASKADYRIIVFGEEAQAAYDRVHLSEFFLGKTAADLSLVDSDFFSDNGISLYLNDAVIAINRDTKTVLSKSGRQVSYDKLVFATGSAAFVPPITGHDRPQCFAYRTLADLQLIAQAAKTSKVGTVIGGGLLGLEAANALQALGLKTHIVESAQQLMNAQLNETGGQVLRRKIEALGISVHTAKNTLLISEGSYCHNKLSFSDASELETDIVLFSAGIRARDELAKACGLAVAERGGISIDHHCKTSDESIYAIGECAAWNGQTYGLVAAGYAMARVLAAVLVGRFAQFMGSDSSTKLKLLGVDVASIGDAKATDPTALIYGYQNDAKGIYKRLVVSCDNQYLLGAILIGDASEYGSLLAYYQNYLELPPNPETLILPNTTTSLDLANLADSASVCACLNVSKGQVCNAISAGCHTLAALKETLQVGSGCGACTTTLQALLDSAVV
jgi:nitrite reductase (NADH) large subunit